MWALAAVVGCTRLLGWVRGTRDGDGADRWRVAATEAGWMKRNARVVRAVVEGGGDRRLQWVVRCGRMGAWRRMGGREGQAG